MKNMSPNPALPHISDRERLCYYEGMHEAFNKLLKYVQPKDKEKIERNMRLVALDIIRISNRITAHEENIKEYLLTKRQNKVS